MDAVSSIALSCTECKGDFANAIALLCILCDGSHGCCIVVCISASPLAFAAGWICQRHALAAFGARVADAEQ
jgi:hypothetical protein